MTWDTMTEEVARTFDVPVGMLVRPHNEHVIPFAFVSWDRLERGIIREVQTRRLDGRMRDSDRLPDGGLYMHAADYYDLMRDPGPLNLGPSFGQWPPKPWGYQLITTQRPDGQHGARRGCPVLRLNDGTEVPL